MSHIAEINAITDDLVRCIWQHDEGTPNTRAINHVRQLAQRGVKSTQYARVNQFDVTNRLEGLVEKFGVLNNYPLAKALKDRLDQLETVSTRFTPEILSLFLELSDRPAENTKLKEALAREDTDDDPSLTWADILADDPYDEDDEIWKDVDRFSDTSEDIDSQGVVRGQHRPPSTDASSVDEEILPGLEAYTISPDHKALATFRQGRQSIRSIDRQSSLRANPDTLPVTELSEIEIVREALLLMKDYPTTIFKDDERRGLSVRGRIKTSTALATTTKGILNPLIDMSSQTRALRRWCRIPQESMLRQRYRSTTWQKLVSFDRRLTELEQDLVAPQKDTTVSIHAVLDKVESECQPLLRLHDLVSSYGQDDNEEWHLLDALYQECCTNQLAGQDVDFDFFARLFIDCLDTYLTPIRLWISDGSISDRTNISFLHVHHNEHGDRGSIWHDRCVLRTDHTGSVIAPNFIQAYVQRIFAAGKSVMFLHAIDNSISDPSEALGACHCIDFDTVMEPIQESGLRLFSEIFSNVLDSWITTNSRSKPTALCNSILSLYGLPSMLQSFGTLYYSSNGAAFQAFADTIFGRIDQQRTYWADRFVLTENLQAALGQLVPSHADHISVRVVKAPGSDTALSFQQELRRLKVHYTIPWQLQNITRESSPSSSQSVMTLLLQVYRVIYLLKPLSTTSVDRLRIVPANLAQAIKLRHHLLWFANTLQSHICETASQTLQELLAVTNEADDIDAMVEAYGSFSSKLVRRLLLTERLQPILSAVLAVLEIAETLGATWKTLFPQSVSKAARDVEQHNDFEMKTKAEQEPAGKSTVDMTELKSEHDRLLSFAVSGLRSIARVGAEPSWTMLVEKLDYNNH